MLTKEVSQSLSKVVKNKEVFYSLKEYCKFRIDFYHKQLEQLKSFEDIKEAQGAIKELRRFETLYEEVEKGLKDATR